MNDLKKFIFGATALVLATILVQAGLSMNMDFSNFQGDLMGPGRSSNPTETKETTSSDSAGIATLTYEGIATAADADTDLSWITANNADVVCTDDNLWSNHKHGYINTAVPDPGYAIQARITKFRIYLEDDFMENVDLDSIICSASADSGVDTVASHCIDGYRSDGNGGMSVTLVQNDRTPGIESQNYFEWQYGLDDPAKSIVIDGQNDWNRDGVVDEDDGNVNEMYESISFLFKDDISRGSATTNSSVYLVFGAYDQRCGDKTNSACWELIEEDDVPGTTDYHWNIESVPVQSTYYCPNCTSLQVTPNVTSVNDLYATWDFNVTAYNGTEDITDQLTYDYGAYSYASWPTNPDNGRTPTDAEGNFWTQLGSFWLSTTHNYLYDTDKTHLRFGQTNPGDTITVVANDFEDTCFARIEFPFCYDLTINEPAGNGIIVNGTAYDTPIDVSVTAQKKHESAFTYEEAWPFPISYESTDSNATFDGNLSIYTPDPQDTHINTYHSAATSATVDVYAQPDQDVARRCSDAFTYALAPTNTCEYLQITQPTTDITVDQMNAGNVYIRWDSIMTDGTSSGPWEIFSTNTTATFTTTSGTPLSVYNATMPSYLSNTNEVLYTGTPGDIISVRSIRYPSECNDQIGSEEETPEVYYCDDLTLDGPYLADGSFVDTSIDADVTQMYDEDYVCFNYEINVDDPSYSSTIFADTNNPTAYVELTENQTGGANAAYFSTYLPITGFNSYDGQVCLSNFDETTQLNLSVYGASNCEANFTFPDIPEEEIPEACEYLEMSPDAVTMTADATDAGTINITVTVSGDTSTWTGNLVITATDSSGAPASGELFYADGSPSTYTDGHLEIPVTGMLDTANATYVGGLPNDIVTAYIEHEEDPCSDEFTISQEGALACYDLSFDTGIFNLTENDVQDGHSTLTLNSDLTGQTLVIEYNGCSSQIIEYESASYSSPLTITGVNGSDTFDLNFVDLCEDAEINAYIAGWEAPCSATIEAQLNTAPACYDLSFDINDITVSGPGESAATTLTLNSNAENQTLNVTYNGCTDGEILYDGRNYTDHVTINGIDGGGTYNFGFTNLCPTADIHASVDGWEEACTDRITVREEVPVCYDLSFGTDAVTIEGEGEDLTTTLSLNSDLEDQTVNITYNGCEDGEIIYEGSHYDDHVTIPHVNGDANYNLTFANLCEDAEIRAFVEGQETRCADSIAVTMHEEVLACYDLSFDLDSNDIIEGEDLETTLDLNSDIEDQTLVITYSCDEDINVEYNGTAVSGTDELHINHINGDETFDVTFENVCQDARMEAYIEDYEDDCADEISPDVLTLGEFNKYIYTFNFASEKNSYSDEGIFFSHDEDRAFYTLEYDPSGTEDNITFTDEMWTGNLRGKFGDGTESGGYVSLAESYDELTSSSAYGYSTIERFGFGSTHEANSDELARIVQNWSDHDYHTFVPYIKYSGHKESEIIPECEYSYDDDGNRDELESTEVCYDPEESPETTGRIVIENTSEVEDLDEDATIRIRYVGVVHSNLSCSSQTDDCLLEEFENNAEVEVYESVDPLEADARLVVLCSYLVTRNAGDIYLEIGLQGGSDISCIFTDNNGSQGGTYSNTDGIVIQDASSTSTSSTSTSSTSTSSTTSQSTTSYGNFTVSFCDDSSDGSLISNLSSYVCEIVTSVSELWKKTSVEQTTDDRITQATRNVVTNQTASTNYFSNWSDLFNTLHNQNNPNSGILYFDGALSNTITLDGIEIPSGAWTLIVENATLRITEDITYATTTSYGNIPSMAFVVTGGDIYITTEAHEISGVFYTDQSFDGDVRSAVNDPLTFYGSIYGNVQPLLDAAKYVGPPTLDGGGIVVRYDSRIILNTPPGLSEYVDVNTQQGVN